MKKRIIASLMTVVMLIMAMSTFVCADEEDTYGLTVKNDVSETGITIEGKVFDVYQIFSATVNGTNIEYTLNTEYTDYFADKFAGDTGFDTVGDYLESLKDDAVLQTLAEELKNYISTNDIGKDSSTAAGTEAIENEEYAVAANLAPGYYLVLDSTGTIDDDTVLAPGALVTLPGKNSSTGNLDQDVEFGVKASKPSIDKTIYDDEAKDYVDDAAEYQIGEEVEYKIVSSVPTNITGYENYIYRIIDTLSEGLEYIPSSLAVSAAKADGTSVSVENTYTNVEKGANDTFTFQLDFTEIEAIKEAGATEITVTYKALVTADAKVYDSYEQNDVTLEYGNNPYTETEYGTAKDTVYSYTFAIDVFKTKGGGVTALAGAEFQLSIKGGENITLKFKETVDGVDIYVPTLDDTSDTLTGKIVTSSTGKFTIQGLDDNVTYVLTETAAPSGYNEADPVEFVITVTEYNNNEQGIPTPTLKLTVDGTEPTDGYETETVIVNTSATLLPTTGGMGTTIFMIGGGIMMFAAVVLLATKRRRANA